MAIVVNNSITIPDSELTWRFTASGGPGGQHANRANTRVEVVWSVADSAVLSPAERDLLTARLGAEVRVVADTHRSQTRNRDEAARRLAQRCREALTVQARRRPTKPSAGSRRRRLQAKRERSETKRMRRRPGRDDL